MVEEGYDIPGAGLNPAHTLEPASANLQPEAELVPAKPQLTCRTDTKAHPHIQGLLCSATDLGGVLSCSLVD